MQNFRFETIYLTCLFFQFCIAKKTVWAFVKCFLGGISVCVKPCGFITAMVCIPDKESPRTTLATIIEGSKGDLLLPE